MSEKASIELSAVDKTRAAFDSLKNNLKSAETQSRSLSSAMGMLVPSLTLAGLAAVAKSSIDSADALNDLSQRTQVSVKTLADWKLAADQSDTSLEALGKGVQKLTLSIGQAEQGSKEQAAALQSLGVTARDPQLAFEQLADAVANSNDPIKTNADLQKVLGKNYAELLPLLQGGAQGLRDSAAASATFSEAMVSLAPNADKLNDQLAVLKMNAAGAAASILSELVPSFNEWIAVGREVWKTGTLLDKVRFFGLGNASDEMVRRVRLNVAASSGWAKSLKESADSLNGGGGGNNGQELACVASGGTWDGTRCIPKPTKGPSIDKEALAAEDLAAAWKQAGDELQRYQDDLAFMADVDLAQMNGVNEIAQQWADAGRALTDDMMTPLEKANLEFGRLDELLARGVISWETYSRAVFKTQESLDTLPPKISAADEAAQQFGVTFTSALEDAIVNGEGVGDMLKGLEQDLARMLVRMSVTEPLMAAVKGTDWGSVLGGLFANADGGVYSSPGLSAYSGTVVDRPTLFPFAAGAGLMGEAGPEAILPLKRGNDGKLGIEGGGGGVQVNVINNAGGTQATATEREENGVRIVDVMVEQVEGAMSRRLGRGEGLAPVMERRYGLNPAAGAY